MKKILIILCMFLMAGATSVFAGEITTEGFNLNLTEKKVVEIGLKKAGLDPNKTDVLFKIRDAIGCEAVGIPLVVIEAFVVSDNEVLEGYSVMPKGQEFKAAQKALKDALAEKNPNKKP